MQVDSVLATPELKYENDLSFLLDAPTPPRRKGVRWEKNAKCKPFYFDERVSEMLDSTLETITSSPVKNYHDVLQNPNRGASERQSGRILFRLFTGHTRRKLALAPPPPKPLVTPLSPSEEEILQDAAAKTNHGRNASQWVIEEEAVCSGLCNLVASGTSTATRGLGCNDNIVNEYLSILVAAKKKEMGFAHKHPRYLALDQSVPAQKGKQYLDADLILYPICDKGHRRLLVVYPQERSIEYLDSMGLDGQKYIDHLVAYLARRRLGEHWVPGGSGPKKLPSGAGQQLNGSDCGVFTLMNALVLIRGDAPDRVVATNGMDDARRLVLPATLLAGQPTTELE
ncbi:unnamed protein product [Alternaria alternata]